MNNKISVIVPIYSVEKYLSKCIDSIINQTYTNLEIILVDDGSPDNCSIICDDYSLMDIRIKVIHKKNGGLSDARNAGLNVATGDYISFLDSDDYIHKEFYETLINLIIQYDADVAQCEFLKVYEDSKSNPNGCDFDTDEKISVLDNREALNNLFNEYYVNTVVVWNKLYKRELFKSIRYPKGKIHEDEYTTYKVLFVTNKVVTTSKQLYYYLQRENSIMGKGFNIKSLDKIDAYYGQVLFYNDKKLFELEVKAKSRLEGVIRESMIGVLNSTLDGKDKFFNNLINYYRRNYALFRDNINVSIKKKVIMILFKYSPKFIVKLICNTMYLKSKVIN